MDNVNSSEKNKPKYNMWQNTAYMLGTARRSYVGVIVLCLVIAVTSAAKSVAELLISPAILGKIESGADVLSLLGTILAFTAALFVLSALQNYFTNNALPGRIGVRMRIIERMSEKLANTSYPNTLDTRFMEAFAKSSYATAGNGRATEAFWTTFTTIITYAICFVVYLFLISGLNVFIALFVLALSIAGYFVNKRINEWKYRHRDEESEIYNKFGYIEKLSTDREYAKEIRLFGLKNQIDDVWKSTIRTYRAFVMKREKTYIWANVTDTLIMLLRSGAAYAYLIHMALAGEITVTAFLLYFGAIGGFAEWVTGLLGKFSELHKQSLDISVVREFTEWKEQFKFDEGEPLVPENKPYEIRLENVSFRYAGAEKDTLRGINLTVHPGEKLAVVGLNGAGKTTLVKLICGFLDPTEGRVLLDGEDIRKYNRRDYYKMFSAVFQDFSLLEATVAENVAQKTDGIDVEKMKKCVREAGLAEKIESLPAGYETHIGKRVFDDGVELSGGQTQRLMLARALYKDAPVLLLDEPTAALDPIAENEIYMKYNEMTRGRTSIFISHRLASTRFCDRILFVAGGHIAEEGTHEELLAKGGGYAELFEVQSKYYREEGAENEEK